MVEASRASDLLRELITGIQGCFARVEPWIQAGKYVRACMSDLGKRNGWTIAEWAGDATPDKTQRLLNHGCWDAFEAMSVIRRFVITGLDAIAGRPGLRIGALDETGQQKHGTATAGVKRQHLGCAGRVANGINTVHLSYIRQHLGHALIGFRQWIPREQLDNARARQRMGLPPDLAFATKGELAVQILRDAYADGMEIDFACGDEVYGSCPALRCYLEDHGQGYVLRVAKTFPLTFGGATTPLTCAKVVTTHLRATRHWQVVSAGTGSNGERDYAWAWIATASPRHWLLIRRHLTTAIARHTVLITAALAVCAIAAARARQRTDTQAPPPASPDSLAPEDPGQIPLTVAEIKRLLNAVTAIPRSIWHAARWSRWRRRRQARARWYHKRARLARQPQFAQVKP